jgi:hypothetical protein
MIGSLEHVNVRSQLLVWARNRGAGVTSNPVLFEVNMKLHLGQLIYIVSSLARKSLALQWSEETTQRATTAFETNWPRLYCWIPCDTRRYDLLILENRTCKPSKWKETSCTFWIHQRRPLNRGKQKQHPSANRTSCLTRSSKSSSEPNVVLVTSDYIPVCVQ